MIQSLARISFAVTALAALAACSGPVETRARFEAEPTGSTTRYGVLRSVGSEGAFVRMPAGTGIVMEVREVEFTDGVGQQMVYGSAEGNENRLDVGLRTNQPRVGQGPSIPMVRPSEEGIRVELSERFPSVSMQVVARPMRNAYGQYGLAIGRGTGGMRCIYAWQWIDDVGDVKGSRAGLFAKLGAVAGTGGASGAVRFRMCRNGVSVDQLAGSMNGLIISRTAKETANVVTRGDIASTRSLESELTGVPDRAEAPVVVERPVRRRVVRRAPPAEPQEQPYVAPAPRNVPVPPPAASPIPQPTAPNAPPEQPGTRYLGPVPQQQAPRQPTAPSGPRVPAPQVQPPAPQVQNQPRVITPSPIPVRQTLDPSLPAAAYQGPSGRNAQ
ncbi:hypothetical protein GJW-30_1_02136 [Variibacter gotjawalensis]|uniref:Cellulose biosynthesis protein BcsN n=1 Tax=Variibacter gotjawalensis TaxID=1333996 RepID=A0A0S3PUM8_9BRAD|nr:cellulose biosynthesis protein BcsN [Variibacter gotjawalensis]NIK49929.1 hypothetical protein [Variibacter gotjawalensis]RZS45928.1 hypothetical protein EV661_4254 [Variibacter gotjawalensis]BAT59603.1 hypothetical protein GJW-30_1_02136 [Variibacter gotjawalensis]